MGKTLENAAFMTLEVLVMRSHQKQTWKCKSDSQIKNMMTMLVFFSLSEYAEILIRLPLLSENQLILIYWYLFIYSVITDYPECAKQLI